MTEEKIIVVDLNLTRGLVVVMVVGLLTIALLGYLVFGHEEAAASDTQPISAGSAALRQYYVTKDRYEATNAKTACAQGYHFASLWEIWDPSNLKYNTDLGLTRDDSGQGPPSGIYGWVRTGYNSELMGGAGTGNCDNWTDIDGCATKVELPINWVDGGDIGIWDTLYDECWNEGEGGRVWCVED